jgi:rare lipoprotein A|tara:strand:- start:3836 stop:4225 length:390 start_codon:yes stop_codon:yes gene_type:complete
MKLLILAIASIITLASCHPVEPITPKPAPFTQYGEASWYAIKCNGGTHTASGKRLVDSASTAAHKELPMGTVVKVTNLNNNKFEVVTITDRGPYIKGRIIDVTVGVAERLGFKSNGVTEVKIVVVGKAN